MEMMSPLDAEIEYPRASPEKDKTPMYPGPDAQVQV